MGAAPVKRPGSWSFSPFKPPAKTETKNRAVLPPAAGPLTMAATAKSIFFSARQSFWGKTTANGTAPPPDGEAAGIEQLFPKVKPEIDGDDCDHDCDSCSVKWPKGFKVDEDDQLYGFIKGWSTHVLVATGKTDWVRDVEDEKGSVMEAFRECGVKPSNGRLMLSASNIPTPTHHNDYAEPTTILLLPAFRIIENVKPSSVGELIEKHINTAPTNTSPLGAIPQSLPDPLPSASDLTSRPSPHRALILLCSQRTRDARCGQSAPLLRKELERHLRLSGLYRDLDDERPGGVGIYFISHVGGHKYSANVMIYRKPNAFGLDDVQRGKLEGESFPKPTKGPEESEEAAQCIWLARVRPEDCEGLVKYTVLQGKVIKPERQLRGGFDRQRGLFSW